MDKKNYKVGWYSIEEQEFHQHESPISKNNLDINNIVVSNELLFGKQGFKYFIGYKDAKKIRPLCKCRTKMSIYKRNFDKARCMYFSIKDEKF